MTTLIKTFLTRWFFKQTCLLDTIQLVDRCQTHIPLWDLYLVDTRRMESIQLRDFPVAPSSSLTLCHIKVCRKSVLSLSLLIIIRHVYFFYPQELHPCSFAPPLSRYLSPPPPPMTPPVATCRRALSWLHWLHCTGALTA